jgi:hypothetical protein
MHMVSLDSKQIAYVAYDDHSAKMTAHYHSGEVRIFPSIRRDDYEEFLYATNKYDAFIKLTSSYK